MYAGKPIIGIIGGIGSGKTYVARVFGELGCRVISSDEQVSRAYQRPDVREQLRQWWGEAVFRPDGSVDRAAIADRVFADPAERVRLEGLIHPLVRQMRDEEMAAAAQDAQVLAYVWDTPLIVEAGLAGQCDAIVFVDAALEVRLQRVAERGWDEAELLRREKSQAPLDKKRKVAKYMVRNTAGADEDVRNQVRKVLTRVVAAV